MTIHSGSQQFIGYNVTSYLNKFASTADGGGGVVLSFFLPVKNVHRQFVYIQAVKSPNIQGPQTENERDQTLM